MSNTLYNLGSTIQLPSHYPKRVNALISTLLNYANEKEGYKLWASVKTLASRSGYSERQVHRLLKQLTMDGALEKVTQKSKGIKSRPIVYRIVISKLEEWGLVISRMTLVSDKRKTTIFSLDKLKFDDKDLLQIKISYGHLNLKASFQRFKLFHKIKRTYLQWLTSFKTWLDRELKLKKISKNCIDWTKKIWYATTQGIENKAKSLGIDFTRFSGSYEELKQLCFVKTQTI